MNSFSNFPSPSSNRPDRTIRSYCFRDPARSCSFIAASENMVRAYTSRIPTSRVEGRLDGKRRPRELRSLHLSSKKLQHQLPDRLCIFFQREVPRIQQMQLRLRLIPQKS